MFSNVIRVDPFFNEINNRTFKMNIRILVKFNSTLRIRYLFLYHMSNANCELFLSFQLIDNFASKWTTWLLNNLIHNVNVPTKIDFNRFCLFNFENLSSRGKNRRNHQPFRTSQLSWNKQHYEWIVGGMILWRV